MLVFGPMELLILGAILIVGISAFIVTAVVARRVLRERNIKGAIREIARESQECLNARYAIGKPQSGSALDQVGLQDGFEIVADFLKHGEFGVAFDHLLYMIFETPLELSLKSRRELKTLGMKLGVPEAYQKQFDDLTQS